MLYEIARRFLFRLEAEEAHELVSGWMERTQGHPLLLGAMRRLYRTPARPVEAWGLKFSNPLGIAAGFDKNGRLVELLAALGFGFVEVGTVTLRPQPGNPRPRLFRDPAARALVNRLGFNNDGAAAMAKTLESVWRRNRAGRELPPLFVNIGKNKDVAPADAVRAYRECYRIVAPLADGVVVNVSSPNTPGLRDLQREESLREILDALKEERSRIAAPRGGDHPIIVKIAPDLAPAQLDELARVCVEDADGMTATNTTLARDGWSGPAESGGLSGRPLFERSTAILRALRERVGDDYPLIGVGGIMDGADAAAKLKAGATLVQAYTGFVYGGPAFASRTVREMMRSERH